MIHLGWADVSSLTNSAIPVDWYTAALGTLALGRARQEELRKVRAWVLVHFFFSSRRRHTRCSRDWSSDVCSSDLPCRGRRGRPGNLRHVVRTDADRKSVVSGKSVDLGGRRIIKKKRSQGQRAT